MQKKKKMPKGNSSNKKGIKTPWKNIQKKSESNNDPSSTPSQANDLVKGPSSLKSVSSKRKRGPNNKCSCVFIL